MLARALMDEIEYLVQNPIPVRLVLEAALIRNGAFTITDEERASLGLEPRDADGWTPSERVKREQQRRDDLLRIQKIVMVRDVG